MDRRSFVKIIVCIKQVPATQKIGVDPQTGVLLRDGVETKMNPFDLYALETALQIKETIGATIAVITMGPPNAQAIIDEAYALGADEGYLLTDRKFAGADVLATSFTLANGISQIKDYDLIICGKQTTDGDTAQVGPAIAEHLSIPHVSWVLNLEKYNKSEITVRQDLGSHLALATLPYPCLITVEKDIFTPRLPSYLKKLAAAKRQTTILTLNDLVIKDENRYGLAGSPTQVERIFEPTKDTSTKEYTGSSEELSKILYQELINLKFLKGGEQR